VVVAVDDDGLNLTWLIYSLLIDYSEMRGLDCMYIMGIKHPHFFYQHHHQIIEH